MKIDLSKIDRDQFMVHEHVVAGVEVVLVQPVHIGAVWAPETMIFRSSVWDKEGNLISAGLKKFFNDQEKPDLDPLPSSIKGGSLFEKIDGSLLIWTVINGQLVARTRGTVDAEKQIDNGYEIAFLKDKFPGIVKLAYDFPGHSVLTEWTTPTNVIVLRYEDEPSMRLLGVVRHSDYAYLPQKVVDVIGTQYGLVRPQRYSFDSLDDMRNTVSAFQGKEGICFYYNNDQCIRKFKSVSYLRLHRVKSEVSSLEKVVDLWADQGYPTYQAFLNYLEKTFDFEIMVMARPMVSKICDAWKEVGKIIHGMNNFLTPIMINNVSRKDAAALILQAYGPTNRSAMVFALLDRKPLSDDQKKKLLYQVMKN